MWGTNSTLLMNILWDLLQLWLLEYKRDLWQPVKYTCRMNKQKCMISLFSYSEDYRISRALLCLLVSGKIGCHQKATIMPLNSRHNTGNVFVTASCPSEASPSHEQGSFKASVGKFRFQRGRAPIWRQEDNLCRHLDITL